MKKLSIIIPCYNEEKGMDNLEKQLIPTVNALSERYNPELIFVDDGSNDRTNELLNKRFGDLKGVKIIRHKTNKNLGAAMRTGFANATGDVVTTMDSDCTYNPQEIFAMLELLDKDADIVTASPYHPEGGVKNVPFYRLLLSRSITGVYRLLTGSKIHTFTALFRAYKRKVVENIEFKSDDFLATAEILVYALNKGYKVKEHPTTLSKRAFGDSKMKLMKVIWSHFKFASSLLFLKLFKSTK